MKSTQQSCWSLRLLVFAVVTKQKSEPTRHFFVATRKLSPRNPKSRIPTAERHRIRAAQEAGGLGGEPFGLERARNPNQPTKSPKRGCQQEGSDTLTPRTNDDETTRARSHRTKKSVSAGAPSCFAYTAPPPPHPTEILLAPPVGIHGNLQNARQRGRLNPTRAARGAAAAPEPLLLKSRRPSALTLSS